MRRAERQQREQREQRQQGQQGQLGLFFLILEFLCCLCCPYFPYQPYAPAHLNQREINLLLEGLQMWPRHEIGLEGTYFGVFPFQPND